MFNPALEMSQGNELLELEGFWLHKKETKKSKEK